jgi:hypothetical protein
VKDAINYLILGLALLEYEEVEVDQFRSIREIVAGDVLSLQVMDVTKRWLERVIPSLMATVNISISIEDPNSYEPAMRKLIECLLYYLEIDESS